MATSLWSFRGDVGHDRADLTGMKVEAVDGSLGKIEEVVEAVGGEAYLVVDTGLPMIGKTVAVPAGVVTGIDVDAEVVTVDRTKDELKDAPKYDVAHRNDPGYRDALTRHYGAVKPRA